MLHTHFLSFFRKGLIPFTLTIFFTSVFFFVFPTSLDRNADNADVPSIDDRLGVDPFDKPPLERSWQPPSFDLAVIKNHGCIADGLLSDYNEPDVDIPLARASNCRYFHRALETWLEPPDFNDVREVIELIGRDDVHYGMFIAEAIDTKADYLYRLENRDFEFSDMCRKNSKNFWGEHTCRPTLKDEEYRAYLDQITRDAMDIGIRVFLFGQIHHQEENIHFPKVDNVIRAMRAYADSQDYEIFIGAQTGDITNKKYLSFFDFIDGGVGVRSDGIIEDGPCFSRFWQREGDWCWPLMWHDEYTSRAEHIFISMDWNGQIGDDMHVFASMPAAQRHDYLARLQTYMARQDVAFFPPLITPLPRDGTGNCHGPRKRYYSPSMEYGCKDIDVINDLLR